MLLELAHGDACLQLAPSLGGRVMCLRLASGAASPVEILQPITGAVADLLRWPKGGIYPLVPYAGRIRGSRLASANGLAILRPHPDSMPHTLHGPAHRHPWRVEWARATAARMQYDHDGDEDWPWRFRVTLSVALPAPERCELHLALDNTGDAPMPARLGFHPYFAAAGATRVMLDVARDWPMDRDHLSLPQPGDPLAWDGILNGPVTRQLTGWSGRARLRRPDTDIILQAGAELGCVVLHRPANAEFLCLEPVSHIADAFNLAAAGVEGSGACTLAVGDRLTACMAIALVPRT